MGGKSVDAVTAADVMDVLLPIWSTRRVTATRVRQRIGAVMKWAIARGLRDDNPAGDAIAAALPKTAGDVERPSRGRAVRRGATTMRKQLRFPPAR